MRQAAGFGISIGAMALLGACVSDAEQGGKPEAAKAAPGRAAVALIRNANPGDEVARATAREVPGGLAITVEGESLPPGTHGVHIHAVGKCDAPDFMTAGTHWNPAGKQHGANNPAGPHQGDLPNLVIGNDAKGKLTMTLPGATMDGLLDADGSAMVIHADPDDLMTDPSGKSGARIACGVFAPA